MKTFVLELRQQYGRRVDVSVREWLGWAPYRKHVHKLERVLFDPDAIQSHEEARDSWGLEVSLHERVGEFLDEAKAQDELDQHRDQDGNRTTTEAP